MRQHLCLDSLCGGWGAGTVDVGSERCWQLFFTLSNSWNNLNIRSALLITAPALLNVSLSKHAGQRCKISSAWNRQREKQHLRTVCVQKNPSIFARTHCCDSSDQPNHNRTPNTYSDIWSKTSSWPSKQPRAGCCRGARIFSAPPGEQGGELPDCSDYLSTLIPLHHGFCSFFIVFHTLENNPLKLWDLKYPHTHTHIFLCLYSRKSHKHIHSFIHPTEGLHGQLFNQNKSPETGRVQQRRMRGTGECVVN